MSTQLNIDFAPSLKNKLESVDWSFSKHKSKSKLDSLHPYPAKFIPAIPGAFLEMLPIKLGTAVLDPFCGSGTTLSEAQRLGIPSIGVDLNPIACLISRVRTSVIADTFEKVAASVAEAAKQNSTPDRWVIPNIDHWFKPEVQEPIAALIQEIKGNSNEECKDALLLALSSILVRVSNQESDTRYAAIDKPVSKKDVFELFITACARINKALVSRDWPLVPAKIIESDLLKVTPASIEKPVSLVVTSPPYPNAYEYWLYHKYRMWWLGFDPLSVKEQEIGARAHFFKRDHHTAEDFWNQMRGTFKLINNVLVDDGFACFVIGRSKIHGEIVDNATIIQEVAQEFGMKQVARIERIISASRKSFNLSHANIKTETIVVVQK